jgi:hypothetical protein
LKQLETLYFQGNDITGITVRMWTHFLLCHTSWKCGVDSL